MGKRKRLMVELPPGVHRVTTKGKDYFYFHPGRGTDKAGKRVKIKGEPQTLEFWAEIERLTGSDGRGKLQRVVDAYMASPDYLGLEASTQRNYAYYLLDFRARLGEFAPDDITPVDLLELRDSMGDQKAKANHYLSVIKSLYTWAVPRGHASRNPVNDTPRFKRKKIGREPWPDWAFELCDKHMRYDLWVTVQLERYTGQRISDCLKMRLSHIDWTNEWPEIEVVQQKTKKPLKIQAHPNLVPVLKDLKARGWMVLAGKLKPTGGMYTTEQYHAAWGREMAKPALKPLKEHKYTSHGLRKSACVNLAEVGCTDEEIMSVTGLSRQMISTYTAGVNQQRIARNAMRKWRDSDLTSKGDEGK